eukprot:scaffold78667_cov36-Phaeocystis_antarctica.AAC.2
MEKTQAYNLSLGASTHDLKVTVTSTRRASIADQRSGKDQAWMACADKAHKVDGDGGARACSFTPHAARSDN